MSKTTLTFTKTPHKKWVTATARKVVVQLERLGFSNIGPLKVTGMAEVQGQAFIHSAKRAYAVLLAESNRPAWVDIFSLHPGTENGCYGVTNAVAPLLSAGNLPAYFACRALPKVPADILFTEFLKGRPADPQPVSSGHLIPAYELLVAVDEAWTIKAKPPIKGRVTKASTKAATEAAKAKMEEVVREAWRQAREVLCTHPVHELRQLLIGLRYPGKREHSLPTSLASAVAKGNLELAQVFLDNGADLNERGMGMNHVLDAAASYGQLEAVEFLLAKGATPYPANISDFSTLVTCLKKGYYRISKRLIQAGMPAKEVKIAKEMSKGMSPEISALLKGNEISDERLKELEAQAEATRPKLISLKEAHLLAGAEPDHVLLLGPEREAAVKRAMALLEMPEVRRGLNGHSEYEPNLVDLVVMTDIYGLVEAFLKNGANRTSKARALNLACSWGSSKLTTLALREGADPDLTIKGEQPALFAAAGYGDPAIVKLLLDAGADAAIRYEGQVAKVRAGGPFKKQILAMLEQRAPKPPVEKGSAIKIVKAKADFNPALVSGVKDFLKDVGHPEWTIGFIEAPAGKVAEAYALLHPKAKWFADTAAKAVYAEPCVYFLLQFKEQAWTIFIGWTDFSALEKFPADLSALSKKLTCRSVHFWAADTAGCEGYEIFKNGKKIESAEYMSEIEFKSTFRKMPKGLNDYFPDAALAPLGIYLPSFHQSFDGECMKLFLYGISPEAIARVDAFKL